MVKLSGMLELLGLQFSQAMQMILKMQKPKAIPPPLGKKYMYFQVSQPYLGFCPDPKHFIVNFGENTVKMLKNQGKYSEKYNIYTKYFCKITCYADRPYLVFS